MTNLSRSCVRIAVIAALGLVAACATPIAPAPRDVVVRYYTPSGIIVGFNSEGLFYAANGCIFIDYGTKRRARAAAVFPPGTRFSADRRSILLPNGQSIPLGKKVQVGLQAPPYGNSDETCGPRPIQVLELEEH